MLCAFSTCKRLMAPEVVPETEATNGGDVEGTKPSENTLAGGVDRWREGHVSVGFKTDIAHDDISI